MIRKIMRIMPFNRLAIIATFSSQHYNRKLHTLFKKWLTFWINLSIFKTKNNKNNLPRVYELNTRALLCSIDTFALAAHWEINVMMGERETLWHRCCVQLNVQKWEQTEIIFARLRFFLQLAAIFVKSMCIWLTFKWRK